MPTTTGYFQNEYTFSFVDDPGGYTAELALMETNAIAVINYLSDYISWQGTLDFVVQFGDPLMFGADGTGLLPAFGGVSGNGNTFAAHEAFTGTDLNGNEGDVGLWLLPNLNGSLTNYGVPLHFDASPDPSEAYSPPAGTHDFFSIFLHEVLHGLGLWSIAQHGEIFGQSAFDLLTEERNGNWYFTGDSVNALLGQDLRLAATGSRDHYGGVDQILAEFPYVDRGTAFEFGNYAQNRWHLGQLDLAILEDLGFTIANSEQLAVVELPDINPDLTGNNSNNRLFGDHQENVISAGSGDDLLVGNGGNDTLNGGAGNDRIIYDAADSAGNVNGGADTDTLVVIGGTAPLAYDLAAGSFELAEHQQTDAGSQFWSTIVDHYDGSWQHLSQDGLADDGRVWNTQFDVTSSQWYSDVTNWYQNDGGPLQYTNYTQDTGGIVNQAWDFDSSQWWSFFTNYFDGSNNLTNTDGVADDGRYFSSTNDMAGTEWWTTFTQWYDVQDPGTRELINEEGVADDGRTWTTTYDVDDIYSWTSQTNWLDSSGNLIETITV